MPGGAFFGRVPRVETTSPVPSAVDVPARLSSAQKRDLFGQAFAAVITTVLIAAPFMTPIGGGHEVADGVLPAQPFAAAVTLVALAENDPESLLVSRDSTRATRRAPGRSRSVAVPSIAVQPEVVGTTGAARVAVVAPARSASRKPLSRKLTGWLTGDGTHTVRPFPTVAGSRP